MADFLRMSKSALVERLEAIEAERTGADAVEQRMTRAALEDSEALIRGIVNTAVEGIVTIDARGVIASINPAGLKMFGYTEEELIGRNVSVLMPSPYREQHDGYIANYLRTGKARIIGVGREVVGRRKDASVFPMDLSVGEFRVESGRMFAGIVRDITERKRLEREILEISNREQQRIGQDLHDGICQELAGIELVCQTLEEDLSEAAPSEAVRAREIAQHVRETIAHTRGLARGLSPVDLDAGGFVAALRELAASVESRFRIRCRIACDEAAAPRESAIATHLYRIAQEAVTNAIKHGKATEVTITLAPGDGPASLRIEDNGAGLPARGKRGTGMGVQIMSYRAGMIGGTLDIRRAEGRGTVVECLFDSGGP